MNHLLIICGPTAVGKTDLAVQLAKYFGTHVVSADSRQLYKEMNIGTAKPTPAEMQGVPHHFIDCVSIHQNYSAADYERDVLKKLDELFTRHKLVIMCGGTGLYIDAVCKGFDEGMDSNPNVKKEIIQKYNLHGLTWLQQQVKEKDLNYYTTADINNPQRLMRALEVRLITGKPYSSFRKNIPVKRNFEVIKVFINEDRETLYTKINHRVDCMMANGFLKEAEGLFPYKHLNTLNTIGYKELFDYIEGKISLDNAIQLIKQHTRNYAKRQVTWFKNNEDSTQFFPKDIEKIKAYIEIIMQNSP